MANVNPALVSIALEKCSPDAFERYAQTAFGQIVGPKFKPLGGNKDGGADGFVDGDIYEMVGKPTRFFQASKEINVAAKVRKTVHRLREVGREVSRLYFASSQPVPFIDKLQHDLGDEFDVTIDIYDRAYFEQHANHSPDVQAAFDQYMRPAIAFLDDLTGPSYPANSPIANAQAVCAFLGQELERRIGTVKTLEAVCDTLILWALEDTDPDRGKLMTQAGIIAKVEAVIPTSKQFLRGQIGERLRALKKKKDGVRTINHYNKQDAYCLPFETREAIKLTTIDDEKLKLDVTASFIERLAEHGAQQLDNATFEAIPLLLHNVLEILFERQGYDAARHFLDGAQGDALNSKAVVEIATECVRNSAVKRALHDQVIEMMKQVLREVFYSSKPIERTYCSRLARTYILLFNIRNTPEVIEYFNSMARNFELCVGSDLIVRALSEHYLPAEDQMTANALKIIRQAGSKLILTEPTLEELHSHIFAADREYQSSYAEIEPLVDLALASQCDKILVRAYYYAKLDLANAKRPRGWARYLGNFLSYDKMTGPTSPASMKTLRDTLCNRFGFEFLAREAMLKGVDTDELATLTDKILNLRKGKKAQERARAENDALHILHVHHARKSEDKVGGNPFGYRSWWLTQEVFSGAAAAVVFPKRKHVRYIMRPEFLVNYIAYNPTTNEVRASLKTIFPSFHGIRLGTRLDQQTLSKVLAHVRDAHNVDPARAQALMVEYSDALKASSVRQFVTKYDRVA